MRFSRLRLNGFKSFVDPTDLVIHDGLTGVVGPNGCGKSNLLEALRWVMGENRPTAMRGGGMEDVIFAGAASRPARGFAEVALTVDNSERRAPAGFNDGDQLDIVRRITRDAGSAYKANGRDVRARDVQMLFADASTGAHSPALVRQGQISELINARPVARRRVLEEAAGISGLYARRHEAELKLKGVEANLARVDDVLEQLTSQLGALSRQARQALRYREIGAALREAEAVLLYLRWREADAARAGAEAAAAAALTAASAAEREARDRAAAQQAAQDALPPLREEAAIAVAVLQRLKVERDQLVARETEARAAIEALASRRDQLARDLEREIQLDRDAVETLARLDAEVARLQAAGATQEAELSRADAASGEAAQVLAAREDELARRTDEVATLVAHHRSSARLVEDTGRILARAEAEAARADAEAESASADLARAATARAEAEARQVDAQRRAEAAEAASSEAEAARAAAQAEETDARAGRAAAEGEAHALEAELAALSRLIDRETGVAAQVVDEISVAPGHEAALGAALADDLAAPLRQGAGSGWNALPAYDDAPPLPAAATSLGAHVRGPAALDRRLSQTGLVAAAEGPALQPALRPGQRLVSAEGDLWRWDGFCRVAAEAGSAATLRLQQRNRRDALARDHAAAAERAAARRAAHEAVRRRFEALAADDRERRDARKAADRALAGAGQDLSRCEADRSIAEGRRKAAQQARERHRDEALAARSRLAEAEAALRSWATPARRGPRSTRSRWRSRRRG